MTNDESSNNSHYSEPSPVPPPSAQSAMNGHAPFQPNGSNAALEAALAGPMNPEAIQMVMGFLKKHGLTETEEHLQREAAHVIRSETAGGLPPEEAIALEFDQFVKHANSVSDVIQAEFSQMLFPVFAHCFIALVDKQMEAARNFFNKFKIFIPECFAEYLHQLSLIEDRNVLHGNECVAIMQNNKFVVRLSKATMKHLEVIQQKVLPIRNIIAKHVTIEIIDNDDVFKNKTSVETQMGGLIGVVSKNEKRHKMLFSVVKDDLMQSIDRRKTKGKDSKDMGKKMATYCPQADRIPLPPISEHIREERQKWLRDVSKMTIISPETPVSIVMYTTVNAPIGIASCDFSDDSNLIAMGLSDSSIVVNAMDPMGKMKKLREMEHLEKIDVETADNIQSQMFDLQASTSSVRFSGHGGPVFSVNFSPDRRLLLSSGGDRTVRLWSMEIQRNVVIYRTPTVIWQAQFCNRGLYFATASADKTAAVWSTDKMHPLRIFADPYGDVGCVDFHPNCNYVAGGSDDRYVRVWDMLTGTRVRIFGGHKASIIAVKFSPDGRYIVSLDQIGNIMVWDLAYQRLMAAETTDQKGTKGSISFSRDGGVFAVSHGTSIIQLFALDTLISSVLTSGPADSNYEPRINMEGFNIGTYPTKQTCVIGLHFTRRNLLLGFGCYGQ